MKEYENWVCTAYGKEEMAFIDKAYQDMIDSIEVKITDEDVVFLDKAFALAKYAHQNQRRKSKEAYIFHPIAVAKICGTEVGLGGTSIICALLHDVVEDTEFTLEELEALFSPKIAMIVDGLTKLDSAIREDNLQAENFKKVLYWMSKDTRVVLVKIADRLHNMRTLGAMTKAKQYKIASETEAIYAPIAHRLGLYALKTELLDLCLKVTDFPTYKAIADNLAQTKREREAYIKEFIAPIVKVLDEEDQKYRIESRPKSIHSIFNKLRKKNVAFADIYDLFAVRIILDTDKDDDQVRKCWDAFAIVTSIYPSIIERLKNFLSKPKGNEYRSLHLTVVGPEGKFVEVQIRTEEMHAVAERGIAAHWRYKKVQSQSSSYEKWFSGIRELVENKNLSSIEFMNDLMANLFNTEIFVYTPTGELKDLPKGATALDFAFAIHTDIGIHANIIKVNNRIVPFSYKLKGGDIISVDTDNNNLPNQETLNHVITGKAKAAIRHSLRNQKNKFKELGKEILMRKFKSLKIDKESNIETLANYYKFSNFDEFYNAIGGSGIKISDITNVFRVNKDGLLVEKEENKIEETLAPNTLPTKSFNGSDVEKSSQLNLMIDHKDASTFEYQLAPCCNPLPGDNVFGFTTKGKGIVVHRKNCKNAKNLYANYAYRFLEAEWINADKQSYEVDLVIEGVDSGLGVIHVISNTISNELKLNMNDFHISSTESREFTATVRVKIKDVKQLKMAIKTLLKLKDVKSVDRVNI